AGDRGAGRVTDRGVKPDDGEAADAGKIEIAHDAASRSTRRHRRIWAVARGQRGTGHVRGAKTGERARGRHRAASLARGRSFGAPWVGDLWTIDRMRTDWLKVRGEIAHVSLVLVVAACGGETANTGDTLTSSSTTTESSTGTTG